MQTTVISTTATRVTRTPMAASSAMLLMVVEVSVGDALPIVMMVEVMVCVDTLSTDVMVLELLPVVITVVVTAFKIVS